MNHHAKSDNLISSEGGDAVRWLRSDAAISVGDLIAIIRGGAWTIVLSCVVCILLSLAYIATASSEFTATTIILLSARPPSATVASPTDSYGLVSLDSSQADSQIQVVKSERLLRVVFDTLGQDVDAAAGEGNKKDYDAHLVDFMNRVGARRLGTSYAIEISFRAASPVVAAKVANAIAMGYIWDQISGKAALANSGVEFLQSRITGLVAEQNDAFEAMKSGVVPDRRFPDADARIISTAMPPSRRSSPQGSLSIAFATCLGLVLSVLFVILAEVFDGRVRSRERLTKHLDVECLGDFAHSAFMSRWYPRLTAPDVGRDIDSFHKAALALLRPKPRAMRRIGVIARTKGEGTTIIAAGIARALSDMGEQVTLVDANYTHPTLTGAVFERERKQGRLTDDLATSVCLRPNLDLLPNGTDLLNAMRLRAELVRRCLDDLDEHRWVIVDLPPLTASSDLRSVASMLDEVVVVVNKDTTTIHQLDQALGGISLYTAVAGAVLNSPGKGRRRLRPDWATFRAKRDLSCVS